MAKPVMTISTDDPVKYVQMAAIVGITFGGAPAAPAMPAAPPAAAPPMTAPAMPATAPMPPAAPAAPPPPMAAPPPPPAPPAPAAPAPVAAATPGNLDVGTALTNFIKTNGAAAGVALIKQATAAWPDGNPKKNSSKYQDVPPEHTAWLLTSLGADAAVIAKYQA